MLKTVVLLNDFVMICFDE